MVWKCVVPNCSTNKIKDRKGVKSFGVPKDEELCQKWLDAIPSLSKFYANDRICTKHFEEDLLEKKYIKRDCNGKIIAEVRQFNF